MPEIPFGTSTTAAFEGDPNFLATFSGQFEFLGDQDTIKVTLTTNRTYQFFASATQPGATNGDTVITLRDASGTVLVANDSAGSPNSAMTFFAANSGTYYLTVGSHYPDTMGAYSVGVLGSGFLAARLTSGDDFYDVGGSPEGLIIGDGGDDTIWLAAHNLHAFGEQGNDVILAGNEANSLAGGLGDDVVSGSGGDDHLFGDAGDDEMSGGDGNDFIYGGAGIDIMRGGRDNDTMFGGADSDYLRENSGINRLDGGSGADTMWGGVDDDTYVVDDPGDSVSEVGRGGTDTVLSSASFSLATSVKGGQFERLTLTGTAAINGTGNAVANIIKGNAGANVLNGLGGADRLEGLAGNDTYVLGSEATGVDLVVDTAGIDTITSNISRSLLNYPAVENLVLTLGASVSGTGNNLNNVITGNAGNNALSGGIGSDVLRGSNGSDTLVGGYDIDTLTGGAQSDFFVFNAPLNAAHRDVITDFANAAGNNDTIRLENAVMTKLGGAGALKANLFFAGAAAHDADDRIVYNKTTGALFYDSNGNAAGGAIHLATLITKPALTPVDFVVI
jgi:Ca2+-binding RTX toxin-like protein